jgi:hypothetical protein
LDESRSLAYHIKANHLQRNGFSDCNMVLWADARSGTAHIIAYGQMGDVCIGVLHRNSMSCSMQLAREALIMPAGTAWAARFNGRVGNPPWGDTLIMNHMVGEDDRLHGQIFKACRLVSEQEMVLANQGVTPEIKCWEDFTRKVRYAHLMSHAALTKILGEIAATDKCIIAVTLMGASPQPLSDMDMTHD